MPRTDRVSPGGVAFLQEQHLAHFVTLMRDGSPQVTVVWVDVEADGSHVLINTVDGRLKLRNAARDPRVAVSVVDEANAGRFVIVRGRVAERRTEGAAQHIDSLSRKYTGRDYEYNRGPEQRVILRIKPENVFERGIDTQWRR